MSDTTNSNPLLTKLRVIDGITVTLPSGGLLYKEGVLADDVENGEVRVFPMTAREDILLRSADGLYGGTAIASVLQRCVPQVLDVNELFFSDVDYLMVALRSVSYGSTISIGYKHDCDNAKDHEYEVSVEELLRDATRLDPLTAEEQYTVMTGTNQVVKLRPIRLKDMVQILQRPEKELTAEDVQEEIFRLYLSQVASVDGYEDQQLIYEWLNQIPSIDMQKIKKRLQENSGLGINYEQKITCRDCKQDVEISTPINPVTFFS